VEVRLTGTNSAVIDRLTGMVWTPDEYAVGLFCHPRLVLLRSCAKLQE